MVVEDRLERTRLFGLPMVNADGLEPVVEQLMTGAEPVDGLKPLVLTPNVDIVVHLDANRERPEAELFRQAQYCLPDGFPIVAVSRLLRPALGARLAGSDLFATLWPRIVAEQVPVVVVASSNEIADLLGQDQPNAEFIVPPMFDGDDPIQIAGVADQIIAAADRLGPDMILVGVGNPKDARVIGSLLDRWEGPEGRFPVCMGLGASFALHLGLSRRAPKWLQRAGLEWFHRFLQEPRRLFARYFVRDVAFVPIVWREWRSRRGQRLGGGSDR